MTNLHHFYHVYADGDWKGMTKDHLRVLKQYGLMENLSSFNVGIVGSEDNIKTVIEMLDSEEVKYSVASTSPTGWEQVTLDPLWYMAKEDPSAYYLYCHTKGAAHFAVVNDVWRKGMTRHLVVEWPKCVEKLNEGYSTVGCHFVQISALAEYPYWGGNFWWATGGHINALDKCLTDHRHWAEAWLGTIHDKPEFKPYEIWPERIGAKCDPY